jgi:hypothetical protein
MMTRRGRAAATAPPLKQIEIQRGGEIMQIETRDIYCGAYILTRGGRLAQAKVTQGKNNRHYVTLTFTGATVEKDSEEYRSGQAVANVATLKNAVEELKDVVYEKLRAVGE